MTHKEFKNLKAGDCITYTGDDSDFHNKKYIVKSVLSPSKKYKIFDVICIYSKKIFQIPSIFYAYYNKTELTSMDKIKFL